MAGEGQGGRWPWIVGALLLAAYLLWNAASEETALPVEGKEPSTPAESPSLRGLPSGGAEQAKADPGGPAPESGDEAAPIPPFLIEVVNDADEPLEAVLVERAGGDYAWHLLGRTGADGSLRVVIPPAGIDAARVRVSKEGYQALYETLERSRPNRIRMQRAARIEGVVLMGGSDSPLAGATVRAFRATDRAEVADEGKTDAEGRFTLDGAPLHERLFVIARIDGWHAAGVARIFPSEEPLVIRLGGGATLEGHVLRADGTPAVGVTVWLMRPDRLIPPRAWPRQYSMEPKLSRFFYPQVVTDQDGHYRVRGAVPGEVRVPVVWLGPRSEVPGEPVTMPAAGQSATRDIQIPDMGTVIYRTLDHEGTALEKVQVDFESERMWFGSRDLREEGMTPDNGWHEVRGLLPGRWTLRAWLPQTDPVEKEVDVVAGGVVRVTFEARRGLTLTGAVVGPEGKPAAGVEVSWWNGVQGGQGRVGEDGSFSLHGLPEGTGRLSIRPGFTWRRSRLAPVELEDVSAGGEPLRIVLHPLGYVRARDPKAVKGTSYKITIHSSRRRARRSLEVGADGVIETDAPPPGERFIVAVHHPLKAPRIIEAGPLATREDLDLGDLTFTPGHRWDGRVVDKVGAPIAGATVKLIEPWLERELHTGAKGGFRFVRLPERPVWVQVQAPGKPTHTEIVTLEGEVSRHELRISDGGRLRGTVEAPDGTSVEGASFSVTLDKQDPIMGAFDELRSSYQVGKDGRVDLRLAPGRYRIRVMAPKAAWTLEGTAVISDGQSTELRLVPVKR